MKFLASSLMLAIMASSASAACMEGVSLELGRGGCRYGTVLGAFMRNIFRNPECRGYSWSSEILRVTGTTNLRAARVAIDDMCSSAGQVNGDANLSDFSVIDSRLTPEFMEKFVEGGTILNEGYGNFRTPDNPSDSCSNALGDAVSVTIGKSVGDFREKAENVGLAAPVDWVNQCQNNAVMCCWPRDRQCGDNNGNCNENGCEDSDPADNTNLCYMKREGFEKLEHVGSENGSLDVFVGESEGDMHCHGFAWSDNRDDASAKYIGNNFYFVSLFDHMYTRGYVNTIPGQNMCDCVENMASMSRSDCTEMVFSDSGRVEIQNGRLQKVTDSLNIEFQACNGTPKNNDLYSYANKLRITNKLSAGKFNNISDKLFGGAGGNEEERTCLTSAIPNAFN